jgi:hypothetical protein
MKSTPECWVRKLSTGTTTSLPGTLMKSELVKTCHPAPRCCLSPGYV